MSTACPDQPSQQVPQRHEPQGINVAENRKARFDYHIEDKFEAGMVLRGTEVKSLRLGRCNLKDSYARIINNEVWVLNIHIGPYPFAYYNNHEPRRQRKLRRCKVQNQVYGKINEMGYNLIPRVYFKRGKANQLALARVKRNTTSAMRSAAVTNSGIWIGPCGNTNSPRFRNSLPCPAGVLRGLPVACGVHHYASFLGICAPGDLERFTKPSER